MLYILIANNDETTRAYIRKTLEKQGNYMIAEVDSAIAAKQIIVEQGWPNILIIDMMLPSLEGLTLLEQLYKRKLPIVTIATGSSSYHEYIRKAMFYGAVDYLVTPISTYDLYGALERAKQQLYELQTPNQMAGKIALFFKQIPYFTASEVMQEQNKLLESILVMKERNRGEGNGLLYILAAKWHHELAKLQLSFRVEESFLHQADTIIYFRQMAERWVKRAKTLHTKNMSVIITGVCQYVEQNYANEISIAAICERFAISSSHFSRQFKEQKGTTFIQYVNMIRIEKAKELLLQSQLLILDIAERCGFSTLQYFNRAFKKQVGLTPNEYRIRMFQLV